MKYEVRETFERWTTVELDTGSPTAEQIMHMLNPRQHVDEPKWAYTDVYATDAAGNATEIILDW